ncbi:MAG: hypothetical protein COB02_05100 [Candidatus Cloacimonadota bacterium]|nr:MAG: hypothetical protein COB02_05100 [Candidatus Cloacimonadota bacterium]
MKTFKAILLISLLYVGGFYVYKSYENTEVSQVGVIAPNFLHTWFESDQKIDLKKPTFYIAWSSSCPRCITNAPKYNKLYKKFKKKINFVGVSPNIDDGTKELAKHYNRFPMNHDPKQMFFKYFGAFSFPYYVIVDNEHIVLSQGYDIKENILIKLAQ